MRLRATALFAGLLLAGGAACTSDGADPGTDPTTTAPTTTAPAVAAPACVAGQWRATGVSASGDFGAASGSVSGGTGATMNVGDDGVTEVSFAGSEPLDFSAEVAGADIRGQVSYDGSMSGTVTFEPGAEEGTGQWDPEGQIDVADLRGTVRLTEPVSVTLLDNADLSDFTDEQQTQAGGAVDIQPVLRGGTYTCEGDNLRVETEDNGPTMVWTFTRA